MDRISLRQRKCQASWLLNYSVSTAVSNALNAFLDFVHVNYVIVRKSLKCCNLCFDV